MLIHPILRLRNKPDVSYSFKKYKANSFKENHFIRSKHNSKIKL